MDVTVIGTLDGNQSLKRVCLWEGLDADPRKFHSDYYLSENDVNVFQNDIKPRKSKAKKVRCHLLPNAFFFWLFCSHRKHSQIPNLLRVTKKHHQRMAVMRNQAARWCASRASGDGMSVRISFYFGMIYVPYFPDLTVYFSKQSVQSLIFYDLFSVFLLLVIWLFPLLVSTYVITIVWLC